MSNKLPVYLSKYFIDFNFIDMLDSFTLWVMKKNHWEMSNSLDNRFSENIQESTMICNLCFSFEPAEQVL